MQDLEQLRNTMSSLTIEVSMSLTEQESIDLKRFCETSEDGQGYDVPSERMKALADLA